MNVPQRVCATPLRVRGGQEPPILLMPATVPRNGLKSSEITPNLVTQNGAGSPILFARGPARGLSEDGGAGSRRPGWGVLRTRQVLHKFVPRPWGGGAEALEAFQRAVWPHRLWGRGTKELRRAMGEHNAARQGTLGPGAGPRTHLGSLEEPMGRRGPFREPVRSLAPASHRGRERGPRRAPQGARSGPAGAPLGPVRAPHRWDPSRPGPVRASLGPHWAPLGPAVPNWAAVGPRWAVLGPRWVPFGPHGAPLGRRSAPFGPIRHHKRLANPSRGPRGPPFGPRWGHIAPR